MERKYKNVIELAQARGSSATTKAGAIRYMLSHLHPTHPGIAHTEHIGYCRRFCYVSVSLYLRQRSIYENERFERRAERILRANQMYARGEAESIADSLNAPTLVHAENYLTTHWPYRRSQSRWAGGEHNVIVRLAPAGDCVHPGEIPPMMQHIGYQEPTAPLCWGESERAWSDNGKWSGTNSVAKFWISRRALYYFPDLVVAGLVTLDAEKVAPREYKMMWCEQSTGVQLREVAGYFIRGRHVRAVSLKAARAKAFAMRHDAAESAWKNRFTTRQARIDKAKYQERLRRTFVERQDSLAVGNCVAATDQFALLAAREVGAPQDPNAFALRADLLLSLRDDSFTRRAVAHAMQRVL